MLLCYNNIAGWEDRDKTALKRQEPLPPQPAFFILCYNLIKRAGKSFKNPSMRGRNFSTPSPLFI